MTSPLYTIMPTYNEADRYLKEVVTRALEISEGRLFIYDDRSDDGTPEIAAALGAHVWIRPPDVPGFAEHEGLFRQWGWDSFVHEMKIEPGAWVLAQDADEKFYGAQHLLQLMDQKYWDVLGVQFVHMWNATEYRVDKAWKPNLSSRLFRFAPMGEFSKRRLACGSEPNYVQHAIRSGRVRWHTPFVFQHLGYMDDADKQAKYVRYSTLDKGDFHSMAHINSILDPNPVLVPWVEPQ